MSASDEGHGQLRNIAVHFCRRSRVTDSASRTSNPATVYVNGCYFELMGMAGRHALEWMKILS